MELEKEKKEVEKKDFLRYNHCKGCYSAGGLIMSNKKNEGGCGIVIIMWVVASVVIGIILNNINVTGQSIGSIIFAAILIGGLIALAVFCMRMAIVTSRYQKIARQQRQKDKAEGVSRYRDIIHVGGLSIPENCKCSAILKPEGLTVQCGGNEFFLRLDKIKNVDYQLDIDEKQYLKSSMLKGVAGAAAFGISGAVIGSAPNTKTKREVKCYAIISYGETQEDYKMFILKDEFPNTNVCAKLVDTLKPMINTQINRVEL